MRIVTMCTLAFAICGDRVGKTSETVPSKTSTNRRWLAKGLLLGASVHAASGFVQPPHPARGLGRPAGVRALEPLKERIEDDPHFPFEETRPATQIMRRLSGFFRQPPLSVLASEYRAALLAIADKFGDASNVPSDRFQTSERLVGAPIEHEYKPDDAPHSVVKVATHSNGRWRTLQRYGTVQSVTRWDSKQNRPLHHAVGNEYIKVMASAYAALQGHYPHDTDASSNKYVDQNDIAHLHLGIGGGSLPMLINNANGLTSAIDLDQDVISLATQHLGFNPDGDIEVITTDALRHQEVVNRTHSAVFVDVFGADNLIPAAFVERQFIDSVHRSLKEGGVVVANFHRGNAAGSAQVEAAKKMYSEIFGSCVAITSRFHRNVIIAAVKHDSTVLVDDETLNGSTLDIEKARQVAIQKGWKFDPKSYVHHRNCTFRTEGCT